MTVRIPTVAAEQPVALRPTGANPSVPEAEADYWAAASGLFIAEPQPEPEVDRRIDELQHSRSAQRLWEETTTRFYSEEQKKVLLQQSAVEQAVHADRSQIDETAANGIVRAVEAAGGIRQAWKGLLSKPQFRSLMDEVRAPAPVPEHVLEHGAKTLPPQLDATTAKPSAVGSATPAEGRPWRAVGLGDELSSLADQTGVAAPPPGWPGWQHEQQQLSLSSPTFMVLSYIFPEDLVQTVYVSGDKEHVAWSVSWESIRVKQNKARTVSLFYKPDDAYMVGVDRLQWSALQNVRERAKVSEREYLAAQLHCDASMIMYPQRSFLPDADSAESATGQFTRPLHLPVAMKHASRPFVGSKLRKMDGMRSSNATTVALQSVRDGSLPSWYLNAMDAAVAGQQETATASLLRMVESYDESCSAAAANRAKPSHQLMALVPSQSSAQRKPKKPVLLPVANEWIPRSPRITAKPPKGDAGSGRAWQVASPYRCRVGGGFQRSSSQLAAKRLVLLEARTMATSTTRPTTTTGSPRVLLRQRGRLPRTADSSQSARRPQTSNGMQPTLPASPGSTVRMLHPAQASKGISSSVHVSSPLVASNSVHRDQLRDRRRFAEAQLARIAAGSSHGCNANRPTIQAVDSARHDKSGGGQESKSRPVSRVESPAGGFLYSAFHL